ncbi:Adenosylmethionine--8-amino-7-oxononanoate transaminase [Candidatus Filomicrobium marinum]|uniref:Adenosylmethionine-8-amino-7-oxononanoate aminotransferase n=1 Tax=Candidatus Filomicrobium marinum TaxID=1608628 RepID=A0A0D6JCB3_9HYPH|nr:adenosylmethionine--8-amino-7-oxononanoate transaminase [Candidatus Filomicrobium marinum]CFX06192.1 Adenosylmethionine--8-amino-7-oxononanoate transaminase [Candidatus Filomicrobium marinum]CPR16384.1 Adenosylmethionine--8-amino-7-oxononanoate transaminase [Candidatus Filomicrobium marinum]
MSVQSESPVWHPFTQHALQAEIPEIARAKGAILQTASGRKILDAISSWWVVTHGHRHPHIMDAIKRQCDVLDHVIFAGFTHEPAERLAQELIRLAPAGLSHVFYSDSGSTAVEVGLKMALGYWHNRGEPRSRILALEHAYHGDTVGTMSAGARGVFNEAYGPLLFDVERLPFPVSGSEQGTFDALEAACRDQAVAALIVEPLILGAGGMLTWPAETLAEMKRICERFDVLLIADEVMTGWGRTGTLFACEQAGITPDILCLAKGITGGSMPLAATLATAPIFEAHYSQDRTRTFYHSSSYTANPIACAAALANVGIWQSEPVGQRISTLSTLQSERLNRFSGDQRFSSLRQCGTIAAMDLACGDPGYLAGVGPRLYDFFLERDVLLRPLGSTIYVLPPYCVTAQDLDKIYDAISDAAELVNAA